MGTTTTTTMQAHMDSVQAALVALHAARTMMPPGEARALVTVAIRGLEDTLTRMYATKAGVYAMAGALEG